MTDRVPPLVPLARSLSARLLLLTIFFVMLGEVLIFVPSVARFRLNYLEMRIASAHLASLALEATPDNMVSQYLANELLLHVGADGIVVHKPDHTTLIIASDMPPEVDRTYDISSAGVMELIGDAIATLMRHNHLVLRVLGTSPRDSTVTMEVLLDEQPMRAAMWDFGGRVFALSIFLSLIAATLVYLSLQWLLVAPMRRITQSMMSFRENPEDASRVIRPVMRNDEIGIAERELAQLQETVRQALRHNARLAALGTAVTKINHDLRNILSTARLVSDRLAGSEAPEVKRVVPRLVDAIDRAVALCSGTLNFTREGAPPLKPRRFLLASMVEELAEVLDLKGGDHSLLLDRVPPGLAVTADREQLHRVLMNLLRNAMEAGAQRITVRAETQASLTVIDVLDDGPGLPPKALANLFLPFAGSARPGGTGLGLAIAREVMRAHGGDATLVESTARGTTLRLSMPHGPASESEAGRRLPAESAAELPERMPGD
ncbi:MAG TPA: HAMP domain-containing sensor histidine kinase [Stellaceae bacterium]|nr:HAMP domain-containing sensor histidine kinase [Stellaceae bacterium]